MAYDGYARFRGGDASGQRCGGYEPVRRYRGVEYLGFLDVAFRDALLLDNRAYNQADAVPDETAEALLARFRLLEERYREQISDPVLLARKEAAEARRSRLVAEAEEPEAAVRERTIELM